MISSLGRWAAAVALADIGPGPGRSPARPLARDDGSLVEDLAAPRTAKLGALERAGQAGRAQRALLAGRLGLLKLGGQFGEPQLAFSPLARQHISRRVGRPGCCGSAGARHDDPPRTRCPVRSRAAGATGSTGQAGTAGELLGAHDVAVAWICRQRLEPPAGRTVTLADTDLLHRDSLPRDGCQCPERPLCASGAGVLLRLGLSVRRQRPGGHPPHSRSRDPE